MWVLVLGSPGRESRDGKGDGGGGTRAPRTVVPVRPPSWAIPDLAAIAAVPARLSTRYHTTVERHR